LTAFIEQHRQSEKKKKARKKSGDLGKVTETSKREEDEDEEDDQSQSVSESSPRKRQKTISSNNLDGEDQDEFYGSDVGGDVDDVESFADMSQDDNDASVSNDDISQD
jgi:hypothetical protein